MNLKIRCDKMVVTGNRTVATIVFSYSFEFMENDKLLTR